MTTKQNTIRYLTPPSIEMAKSKYCRFCRADISFIDYKDADYLKRFLNEQAKILPRRISGNCVRHQKRVASAIKKARHLGMLPFQTDLFK